MDTPGDKSIKGKYPKKAVLFYDGRCPMCGQAVGNLKRVGLLKKVAARAWPDDDVTDPLLVEAITHRIHSELVFYNPGTKELQGGFQGLLRLLEVENRYRPIQALLRLDPFATVGEQFYKTVSLNRRVLSPPAYSPIACDCDPPFVLRYRVALWIVLLAVAFIGSAVFGGALMVLHPERDPLVLAWQLTLAAGAGWALNFLVFAIVLRNRYWDFVQQNLVVMAIGIFWLMVSALGIVAAGKSGVPVALLMPVTIGLVVLNSLTMFRSMVLRSCALGFPRWVPCLWLMLLEAASVPLFIYFRLFAPGA